MLREIHLQGLNALYPGAKPTCATKRACPGLRQSPTGLSAANIQFYLSPPSIALPSGHNSATCRTHLPATGHFQAAAYINENGIALADYLSLLKEKEEDIIDLPSEEFEDNGRYYDVKNPVATTWLTLFEQIQRRDPLAAEHLPFMACVDPKNIPQSLSPGPSQRKEIDAIGTLTAYYFIGRRSADLGTRSSVGAFSAKNWLRRRNYLIDRESNHGAGGGLPR